LIALIVLFKFEKHLWDLLLIIVQSVISIIRMMLGAIDGFFKNWKDKDDLDNPLGYSQHYVEVF
jgi:hypothetical protein